MLCAARVFAQFLPSGACVPVMGSQHGGQPLRGGAAAHSAHMVHFAAIDPGLRNHVPLVVSHTGSTLASRVGYVCNKRRRFCPAVRGPQIRCGLSSAPLTAVFAVIFLGEVVHWRRAVGIALAFAGVVAAIASPEDMQASLGLLLIFAAAVVSALGAVFLKRLDLSALRLQAWAGASSSLCLIPLSLTLEHGQIAATLAGGWRVLAALAFSSIGVSIIAHTLYFRLLQKHDANLVGPLTLMTPVFAVIAGVAINGDHVGLPLLIGGGITLIGVMVILVRPSANLFKPFLVRTKI